MITIPDYASHDLTPTLDRNYAAAAAPKKAGKPAAPKVTAKTPTVEPPAKRSAVLLPARKDEPAAVEPTTVEPPAVEVARTEDFATAVREIVQAWIKVHGAPKVASAVRAAMRPEPKAKTGTAARPAKVAIVAPVTRKFEPTDTVTLLCKENPKQPGKLNFERFGAVMKAMTDGRCTVAEALKAGATMGDLIYDHERAFIRVEASA